MLDDGGIHAIVNAYGADILSHEQMQIERDSLQHGAVTTYEHSIAVACLSVKIADRLHLWHHVNLRSLVRAALLHDYFLYDWHEKDNGSHRLHGFRHPYTAERNARADFELDDIVSNSIRTHMFPSHPFLRNTSKESSSTSPTPCAPYVRPCRPPVSMPLNPKQIEGSRCREPMTH